MNEAIEEQKALEQSMVAAPQAAGGFNPSSYAAEVAMGRNASMMPPTPTEQPLPQVAPGQAMPSPVPPVPPVPDAQKAVLQGFETQQKATAAEGAAIAKGAAAEAKAVKEAYDRLDAVEGQRIEKEKVRSAEIQKQQSAIQKAQDDYANTPLNSNRLWNNMETGQRVLMGVSLFLGAFGGEGGNKAVEYLDRAIARDIDMQKAELGKKEGALQNARGVYADMLRRFGDERQADAAARLLILDKVGLKLQEAAAGAKGPIAQAQALKGQALYEQEKAKYQLQFSQAAEQKAALMQLAGGSAEARTIANLSPEMRKEYGGRIVNVPGIAKGVAPSEEEARTFRKAAGEYKGAEKSIQALANLANRKLPLSEKKAEAEQLQNALIGQLRVALTGPGAMTDSDRKFMENMIANPTDIFQANAKVKLLKLQNILKTKIKEDAKVLGIGASTGEELKKGAPI
jgi:hypothetical protein